MDPGVREAYMQGNGGPHIIPSTELDRLQGELRRYCRGEVEGRSVLVAGYRGAGKTTLVRHAVYELEGDERVLDKWVNDRRRGSLKVSSLDAGDRKRLARLCDDKYDAELQERLRNECEEGDISADALEQLRRRIRRPLLIELHAPSVFPDEADLDDQGIGQIAISQMVRSLYQSLADRVTADFRDRVIEERRSAQLQESAAQLRLLRHQPLTARQLRPYWVHLTGLRSGVLFRRKGIPHEDQAFRELVAMDVAGQAFAAVQLLDKTKGETASCSSTASGESASDGEEKKSPDDASKSRAAGWGDWAKPVLSLLAAGVLGSGALTIPGVHTTTAFAIGALVLLIAATISLYYNYRLESDAQRNVSKPLPDLEYATLERMFRDLLKHLKDIHLAPVFVLDELDKVRDLPRRMGPLVRSLKKLCAENTFFCFLSDRSYLERLNNMVRGTADPVESTYFTHRLFVLNDPEAGRAFVERELADDSRIFNSYWVTHRSRGLPIDIKRTLARRGLFDHARMSRNGDVHDGANGVDRAPPVYWSDVLTQIAIDAQLAAGKQNFGDRWRFLRDGLYFPERNRHRHQAVLDVSPESDDLEHYLRECMETDDVRGVSRASIDEVIATLDDMSVALASQKAGDGDWRHMTYCRKLTRAIDEACDVMRHADRVQIVRGIEQIIKQLGRRKGARSEIRRQLENLRNRLEASDPLPQAILRTVRQHVELLCDALCLELSEDARFVERCRQELEGSNGAGEPTPNGEAFSELLYQRVKARYGEENTTGIDAGDGLWPMSRFFEALAELNRVDALSHAKELEAKTSDDCWREQLADLKLRGRELSPLVKIGAGKYQWRFYDTGTPVDEVPAPDRDSVLQEMTDVADFIMKLSEGRMDLEMLEHGLAVESSYRWPQIQSLLMKLLYNVNGASTEVGSQIDRPQQQREVVRIYLSFIRDADHAIMYLLMAAKAVASALDRSPQWEPALAAVIDVLGLDRISGLEARTSALRSLLRYCGAVDETRRKFPTRGQYRLGTHGFDKWRDKTGLMLGYIPDEAILMRDLRLAGWRNLETRLIAECANEDWLYKRLEGAKTRDAYAKYVLSYARCRAAAIAPATWVGLKLDDVPASRWSQGIMSVLFSERTPTDEDWVPDWFVWAAILQLGFLGDVCVEHARSWVVSRNARLPEAERALRAEPDAAWLKHVAVDATPRPSMIVVQCDAGDGESSHLAMQEWLPSPRNAVMQVGFADAEHIFKWQSNDGGDLIPGVPRAFDFVAIEWCAKQEDRIADIICRLGPNWAEVRWGIIANSHEFAEQARELVRELSDAGEPFASGTNHVKVISGHSFNDFADALADR